MTVRQGRGPGGDMAGGADVPACGARSLALVVGALVVGALVVGAALVSARPRRGDDPDHGGRRVEDGMALCAGAGR